MGSGSVQASHSASVMTGAYCERYWGPWLKLTGRPLQCKARRKQALCTGNFLRTVTRPSDVPGSRGRTCCGGSCLPARAGPKPLER
jgi:hypothetical protein